MIYYKYIQEFNNLYIDSREHIYYSLIKFTIKIVYKKTKHKIKHILRNRTSIINKFLDNDKY